MFITELSDFFHAAAVFVYTNAMLIMAVLFALVVLNFVRNRMVMARKRRVAKRRAVVAPKPAVRKSTFDPFEKITF